jgi:hypothetical protein
LQVAKAYCHNEGSKTMCFLPVNLLMDGQFYFFIRVTKLSNLCKLEDETFPALVFARYQSILPFCTIEKKEYQGSGGGGLFSAKGAMGASAGGGAGGGQCAIGRGYPVCKGE